MRSHEYVHCIKSKVRQLLGKAERERMVQEVYDRINMVHKSHGHRMHLVKTRSDLILGQGQIP